jgi:hypothetical protein
MARTRSWVRSVERLDTLRDMATSGADADTMTAAMLAPPLLARQWEECLAHPIHRRREAVIVSRQLTALAAGQQGGRCGATRDQVARADG